MHLEKTSPDGHITVRLAQRSMRMSHRIASPRIVASGRDEPLLDLWHPSVSLWDATVTFPREGVVALRLREYTGGEPSVRVAIDVRDATYQILEGTLADGLVPFFRIALSET